MAETKMLIMFDSKNNNNKFYEATLEDSGNISVRFGRVGGGSQSTNYSGGERKFKSLIASKIKKGYKEAQLEAVSGETGGLTQKVNVVDVALRQISCADDFSRALVTAIAKANIHNITSSTNIKYDEEDGLFKTPLGVVKKDAVLEAMNILTEIEEFMDVSVAGGHDFREDDAMRQWNDNYYVLIPNKVATTRDTRHLLYSQKNVDSQREICKALLETLDLIEELKRRKDVAGDDKEIERIEEQIFSVAIEHVTDQKVFDDIATYYDKSKNRTHGGRIMGSKVKNIYKVALNSQQAPFEAAAAELGNVHQLWHGTRVANLLSIMGKGLLMPKASPGQKAGAMFGDGLYFANQSSKSINYCDGMYWTGGSNTGKVYMFLASVAVGKEYVPSSATGGSGRPPSGYDSFWAKAGRSGVQNDEIIVFRGDQVRLDYLLEIEL